MRLSRLLRSSKCRRTDSNRSRRVGEDMYLAFWISKSSCNLMVEKVEKRCVSLDPACRSPQGLLC